MGAWACVNSIKERPLYTIVNALQSNDNKHERISRLHSTMTSMKLAIVCALCSVALVTAFPKGRGRGRFGGERRTVKKFIVTLSVGGDSQDDQGGRFNGGGQGDFRGGRGFRPPRFNGGGTKLPFLFDE